MTRRALRLSAVSLSVLLLIGSLVICAAAVAQEPLPSSSPISQPAAPEPDYHGGHGADVGVAVFSPDGRLVASGDSAGEVFVWEVASGRVVHRFLRPCPGGVSDIAISPDGRLLAVACYRPLLVWGIGTGHQVFSLTGDPALDPRFSAVAFSPSGRLLAASADGYDRATRRGSKTVSLWETTSGTPVHELPTPSRVLAFSPDGTLLATGDGTELRLWDVSSWTQLRTLTTGGSDVQEPTRRGKSRAPEVSAMAFSPDGIWLAASFGHAVGLWQVSTGQLARTLTGHSENIVGIAFSPDGRWLASTERAGNERTIFWDLLSGQIARSVERETSLIIDRRVFGFSPDSRLVALPSSRRDVRLLEADTGTVVRTFAASPVLARFSNWRLLRHGAPQPLATPPQGVQFGVKNLPKNWQYWTVEVDLENHSDAADYFQAPSSDIRLETLSQSNEVQNDYPLLCVWPPTGGGGPSRFSIRLGKILPVQMGPKYEVVQAPVTAAECKPHEKVTLQFVFIAPNKFPASQVVMIFGGTFLHP